VKKLGITSFLVSMCVLNHTVAYAEPYLGVNLGASVVTISKDITYLQTETDLSAKYSGFRAQLLVGYDIHSLDEMTFSDLLSGDEANNRDEFYFAIEVAGNYVNGNTSENITPWFLTTDASVKEELTYSYDIFLLPKYRFNQNVIVFLGPGFTQGKFKTESSDTAGNLGVTGNHSEKLSGWTVKAGIEVPLSRCFSAVATYQYSKFNSKSLENTEPLTGLNVTAKYKPEINSLMLGVNVRL